MLHFPGEMIPGQLGPSSRDPGVVAPQEVVEQRLVLGGDALGDAHDEADPALGRLQDGGRRHPSAGPRRTRRRPPWRRTASATVSYTGTPSTSVPPLPGVTPATTWVP